MAKRGPKPKTKKQLNATDSWRANHVKTKTGAVGAIQIGAEKNIKAPTWMDKLVKKKFREIVKILAAQGRKFDKSDVDIIAGYAAAFVAWRKAELQLSVLLENDKTAYWYESDKGTLGIHPMVQVVEKAYNRFVRAAKDIGLSPLPETRVTEKPVVLNATQKRFQKMNA